MRAFVISGQEYSISLIHFCFQALGKFIQKRKGVGVEETELTWIKRLTHERQALCLNPWNPFKVGGLQFTSMILALLWQDERQR